MELSCCQGVHQQARAQRCCACMCLCGEQAGCLTYSGSCLMRTCSRARALRGPRPATNCRGAAIHWLLAAWLMSTPTCSGNLGFRGPVDGELGRHAEHGQAWTLSFPVQGSLLPHRRLHPAGHVRAGTAQHEAALLGCVKVGVTPVRQPINNACAISVVTTWSVVQPCKCHPATRPQCKHGGLSRRLQPMVVGHAPG
jgi:hypothetical protein